MTGSTVSPENYDRQLTNVCALFIETLLVICLIKWQTLCGPMLLDLYYI